MAAAFEKVDMNNSFTKVFKKKVKHSLLRVRMMSTCLWLRKFRDFTHILAYYLVLNHVIVHSLTRGFWLH